MHLSDVEKYRDEKDHMMRNGHMKKEEMRDIYTKDMFGGPHGINPSDCKKEKGE